MWLHTWVFTNWKVHWATGSCRFRNKVLAWFLHVFPFPCWTKANQERWQSPSCLGWNAPRLVTSLTVATYLRTKKPATVPETCSIQVASESHDPGMRRCIPAVGALNIKTSTLLEQVPGKMSVTVVLGHKSFGRFSPSLPIDKCSEAKAVRQITSRVSKLQCRTLPTFYSYCLVDQSGRCVASV